MIGETAQLVVQLTLKDQLSSGVQKAEGQLGRLNTAAKTSGTHMTTLVTASGKASKAITGLGGALGHASGKIGGLISGPLGLIGLTGGILSLGGALESSVHKIEDFGVGLEKVQTLTGETAQSSGALILLFEKYGLGVDRVTQIAGFAEKTLGKLNTTTAKNAAATKSATLQNLELVKAQRQAAGESVKAIDKLITEQKARDQLANAAAGQAAGVTKLAALDKAYGLNLVDAKGKVVDFSTALEQLATFYDSSASASTKAYVASQVLGRGYTALLPVLAGGSAALRQAAEESRSLGLDQADTAAKLAKFRDATRDLGAAVNVLQLQIGMALVPALTDAAKALSGWLAGGGDKQILDFFKGAANFAQQFGAVVTGVVVPAFKGIATAWNAIPGPLKTLLITGFIANKAGKFLFDKSLFGGLKGLLGQQVSKIPVVGGLLDSAAGVQHVWVDNPGFGGPGLPNVLPGVGAAAGATVAAPALGAAAAVAVTAIAASPIAIAAIRQMSNDPRVGGGRLGFYPGVTAKDLIPGTASLRGTGTDASQRFLGKIADDLSGPVSVLFAGKAKDDIALAVAKGTELGLVHSGVFKKAQAVREAGGFKTSIDALKADLRAAASHPNPKLAADQRELVTLQKALLEFQRTHDPSGITATTKKIDDLKKEIAGLKPTPGKTLGVGSLVTGEAIALATINHLRTDSNPDLKAANYHLRELKALQAHLPAALAAQLAPKIASVVAAINRTTAAVEGLKLVQNITNNREGPNGSITPKNPLPNTPTPARVWSKLQTLTDQKGHASGEYDVPYDMLTKIHKGEMIVPSMQAGVLRNAMSWLDKSWGFKTQRSNAPHAWHPSMGSVDAARPWLDRSWEYKTQRSNAPHPPHPSMGPIEVTVVNRSQFTTRDSNAGKTIKRRYGPTYTQAGAG